ncbi:unnamed protein product [Mytilus edulis]|uniref:Reverse transcriptase domain-containing protein n=1 Tax=Mytilus edulis TaxID=6550 RepID=A0A8S3QT87_MYTED|nr:unnamed protein product [Mytilus edulis]
MTSVHLSEENSHSSIEELRRQEEFSVNMESNEDPRENMLVSSSEMVLMQTAKTDVVNPKNKEKVETRILFDSGSQRTYISQSLASKLNLKGDIEEELKRVTFGTSKLGWIVTGRTRETYEEKSETGLLEISDIENPDQSIVAQAGICDLWNLESIGIIENMETSSDKKAMEYFKETLKFKNGRYYVKWPWKENTQELPDNRELALGRLKSCVARMRKKPDLLTKYDTIIQDQIQKGIVEEVNEFRTGGRKHYISHHAVITPQKSTTKVRIVYDASAKTNKEMPSLNECLYQGPVLLNNLCGIFMRFRLHKIAMVADIEKAFLQVGLQEDDRDVTRFIWLKDCANMYVERQNIQEYRFCRVPFGVISSPFLLAATIEHHVDMYNTPIAEKIKNNIYVDNLISGCESVPKALKFYSDAKDIFKEAAMNLREWISNSSSINELLPASDKTDALQVSVLGHIWNIEDDKVAVKPSKFTVCPGKTTKRRTLMELAEIFDPIGLFSPIIIGDLNDKTCKLLCFCDASARAYSAAVYLHQTCGQSSRSDLIFSKSRLAPVKEMSIPRLELMAVLIGVRSLIFVKSELDISIEEMYLRSDSQCVLKWISTKKELNVFVKNIIAEIKAHKDVKFMYVNTMENPADVATRGTTASKLKNDSLWWHGPKWSNYDTQNWKNDSFGDNSSVEKMYQSEIKDENSRCSTLLCNQIEEENRSPLGIDCRKFSSYTKVIRVTAWIQRFVSRMKKDKSSTGKVLTYKELKVAEMNWIKYIQRKHYLDVFKALNEHKRNHLQRQLELFISQDGILCCRGRLENADISESARLPILLPRGEDLTRSTWRMGRIVKLISSNDGEIRSAKVQLSTGLILGRPLNVLYPLELDCHNENKEVKKFDKDPVSIARPKRLSAEIAKRKIKSILKK